MRCHTEEYSNLHSYYSDNPESHLLLVPLNLIIKSDYCVTSDTLSSQNSDFFEAH